MSKYKLGWIKDKLDERDFSFIPDEKLVQALPTSVDLRSDCPPVYDQGELGSCTANAIAAAFEFDLLRQKLKDFIPSRLFIYYYERLLEGTVSEDAGAAIRDGCKVINLRGVCPESLWPYDTSKFAVQPPLAATVAARGDKSLTYKRVPQTLRSMKACLASGFPIVFGINVYQSFMDASNGDIPDPQPSEQLLGGHALLCVGYDDSTQRFHFRNSWGSSWGDGNGYGTISYGYLTSQDASDFWVIQTVKESLGLLDEFAEYIARKIHIHDIAADVKQTVQDMTVHLAIDGREVGEFVRSLTVKELEAAREALTEERIRQIIREEIARVAPIQTIQVIQTTQPTQPQEQKPVPHVRWEFSPYSAPIGLPPTVWHIS
jgi:C1A family cysteine protease